MLCNFFCAFRIGMTNGKELQAGTDPQDPGSILTVRSIVPVEGGFRLTWSSVSGRSYVLQMADAVDGVYMPVTDVLAGDLSGLNAVMRSRLPSFSAYSV